MMQVELIVAKEADELERFAAAELCRYLERLFGVSATITDSPGETAGCRFLLGVARHGWAAVAGLGEQHLPALSDQGFLLRKTEAFGKHALAIVGGSSVATLWGVYELVERYGVRYLVDGDVYPQNAGPFHLPDLDAVLEPIQRTRMMCLTRDNPVGSQFWSLDDHKTLINQLFKLKFNAACLACVPSCPTVSFELGGIRRVTGSLNYAQDMPIDDDNIGRDHLGAARSVMPPEFEGAETFDEMHTVFKRFTHGLLDHVKGLGMSVRLGLNPLEFPAEFRPLLQNPTTTSIQLGDLTCSEQGDLMNPNHVALVHAVFEAHLDEYSAVDEIGFGLPEHPQAQSQFGDTWQRLRQRFGLSDVDIDGLLLVTRESGLTAGDPQRPEREFKSFVAALDFYDQLFAKTRLLEQMADKGIRPAMGVNMNGAHQALTFAHRALPENTRFSVCDYTASRLVRKLRWLERLDPTGIDPIVMASLQDDNIGWLPQVATQNLHILLQATHRLGWDGFELQHWATGDIDPPTAYLSRASWNAAVTPGAVYKDHFVHVYGEQTIEPLCQVMQLLEDATTIMAIQLGFFFPVLGVMEKQVRAQSPLDDASLQVRANYEEVRRILQEVGKDVTPGHGRSCLDYWVSRMTFSIEALNEADLLRRGGVALHEASSAREGADEDGCVKHLKQARDYHDRALCAGKAAVTAAASNVRSPSDRGGVVAYYHLLVREVNQFIEQYVQEVRAGNGRPAGQEQA